MKIFNTAKRAWLLSGILSVNSIWLNAQDFTVIALPDTQNYAEDYPATFTAQTQWIVNSQSTYNTQFVTHLGDLVNEAGTPSQWQNARNSMDVLDAAGIPYGVIGGNHDFLYPDSFYDPTGVNYLSFFNPSRYVGQPWFGGASPSGLSNYQIITVNGQTYLFLHLLLETPAAELAWAQEILNQHQDKPTWVTTHRYLFDWYVPGLAGRYDDFNYTFEPLYRHDGIRADDFFNNFIAANKQIYMVYCGHNHSEYRQISTNNFGLPVHEVLADYQDSENGGNGWLRINTFRPASNQISVRSYSPTLDQFRDNNFSDTELIGIIPLPDREEAEFDSEFTLSVNFADYITPPDQKIVQLQNGVAGYTGTEDTWINEDSGNTSYGSSGILVVDDDTTNSFFGEEEGQGLLKFTNLTQAPATEANPNPTRIPSNATVLSATLNITLTDDENLGDTTFRVYPMTRSWSESSTWNSLGGGINTGSETGGQIATFQGDNDPNLDFGRTMDITSTVQAWVNGSLANHGLAILRDQTDFNDDGIDIASSENSTTVNRPQLTVEVSFPIENSAPVISSPLSASALTVNEGDEVTLSVTAADPNPLDPLVLSFAGVDVAFATGSGSLDHFVLFEDEGTFSFNASIADDETSVSAGSVTVTVNNLPPVITEISSDVISDVGRAVAFTVEAADPGALDILSYAWDLDGDGIADDSTAASGITQFSSPGIYVVTAEVSDNDGATTSASFTVTVSEIAADGDFDNDGTAIDTILGSFIDSDDANAFQNCLGHPPSPSAPYTAEHCLSAFDADNDGDVDSNDETILLAGVQPVDTSTDETIPFLPIWAYPLLALLMASIARRKRK